MLFMLLLKTSELNIFVVDAEKFCIESQLISNPNLVLSQWNLIHAEQNKNLRLKKHFFVSGFESCYSNLHFRMEKSILVRRTCKPTRY
mmetsp:Transcript_24995/g.37961  ORF Transcript_24995/g.37961 Transcript_24995/m.37961 type:complete len:88 (+) Transcript_24995:2551-2814(+)